MRLSRGALLVLPTITVMIVMFAIFVAGVPRSYFAARIYGGPTEGLTRLAWRLEAVERLGDQEIALGSRSLAVTVSREGRLLGEWRGKLDGLGLAEIALTLPKPVSGPLDVGVRDVDADRVLGQDRVSLTQSAWKALRRERGGWLPARPKGALRLSVAPGRGVFAVPYADPLLVSVERDGRPLPGARLTLSLEGAEIRPPAAASRISDAEGRTEFSVAPLEHVAIAQVRAEAADGATGEVRVSLPVVPGALHARRTEAGLVIASPIARHVAYYAFVDASGRHGGGVVPLSGEGPAGATGIAPLPALDVRPLWVVVSSQPDLRSPAAVGWPIVSAGSEPSRTLDVHDELLLDGSTLGFEREQRRLSRVRWVTFAFCAAAVGLSVALLIARVRAAERGIALHLGGAGLGAEAARLAPSRLWLLLTALLSVLLGFLVLALFALYQVR